MTSTNNNNEISVQLQSEEALLEKETYCKWFSSTLNELGSDLLRKRLLDYLIRADHRAERNPDDINIYTSLNNFLEQKKYELRCDTERFTLNEISLMYPHGKAAMDASKFTLSLLIKLLADVVLNKFYASSINENFVDHLEILRQIQESHAMLIYSRHALRRLSVY